MVRCPDDASVRTRGRAGYPPPGRQRRLPRLAARHRRLGRSRRNGRRKVDPEPSRLARRRPARWRPTSTASSRSARRCRTEKIAAVYLLGMGGSSLCAEVLRAVCGVAPGYPDLHVLDTTDERTITTAAGRLDPARTLFVVASKSGGTVEVASLERFFWAHMTAALGDRAGRHFVAITDPGTALAAARAVEAAIATSSSIPPTSADASRRCRCSASSRARSSAATRVNCSPPAAAMAEGCQQENHDERRPRARRLHRRRGDARDATS